ncbi:branched-chain amino acid aminotransferase [Ilyobacter polytropus]|jgi:branched-chain amino acid aminotransferase|uniref:Branched-chain-amino-acid aminotransferase n=1 Tax=Ilyobacter polytropus (strain ATCC 51220 / DSM 2926 / LMG 16218 / CuHBu1) TaxID=572544 RepID=E3HA57_ILYPC|nr:branched-chain amino acid aminotransferase [Ilyobacter polytropus]ADO83462.1 branched chain amino acid aminotransferase apoenzyme [Ilyobacter polytropus DSM 2926]
MNKEIDWKELGFSYIKADYSFVAYYKDGKWDDGNLVTDDKITISQASPCLHYGQQCFEGLKAYRHKNGEICMFRPDENSKRMNISCERILMPTIPEEFFIESCKRVVKANERFVPPYGSGATLYIRPYIIGVGDNIGVSPAKEYIFGIFVMPVGPYFKGGMSPVNFITTEYDRAAPMGTGSVKVGGNYAGSLMPHEEAVKKGYADCIYLDPATHTKIEEVGAANFFGITKDNVFVTPKSPSILQSITRKSLVYIAENYMGMKVEQRDVPIDSIDEFIEAGACGTAAVISPIGAVSHKGKKHVFYSETEVGEVTKKLYNTLTGIQTGDVEAPEGWIEKVNL